MQNSLASIPPRVSRFSRALLEQCRRDKILIRASGLAFSTLLAFVPLGAVLFALFSAFSAFDGMKEKVQQLLFSQLLPTRQDEIITYFNQFTENTKTLGMVGFIFLIFTAIMLLDNIESNFNEIWHARSRRSLISKITAYTSVLIFGTFFIGASISFSARIKTLIITGTRIEPGLLSKINAWFFPLVLTLTAFLLMYQIIPYTRVRFRSALFGALTAGIFWEACKHLFAGFMGQSVRYSAIYGSLALVPIFLLWVFITWVIVLLGLELSYTHQYRVALAGNRLLNENNHADRLSLALRIYLFIAWQFHRGESPPTTDELAERFSVPLVLVEQEVLLVRELGGLQVKELVVQAVL